MTKNNVLHRDSKSFIFKALINLSDIKAGDYVRVKKDNYGYHLDSHRTEKTYSISPSLLRDKNVFELRQQWNYFSW